MFIEMIKTLSISEEEMNKRFTFSNIELLKDYEKRGKSILLMTSHYASWEWAIILGKHIDYQGYAVYKKIQNKYFDKLVRNIRSKFKATLISTYETPSVVRENENNNKKGVYVFISDQNPNVKRNNHWETFMGVEVPVHMGAEILAKKLDLNVLFLKTTKVKRGYYEATFIDFAPNPTELPSYEITRRFLKEVEQQIKEEPYLYFWTHKRWKHTKENHKKIFAQQNR